MADLLAKEKKAEVADESPKLGIDSLAENIAAALTSICNEDGSELSDSKVLPPREYKDEHNGLTNIDSSEKSSEVSITKGSIESFDIDVHCLISNSKGNLHLLPLDEDFSVLKDISEDKKRLVPKNSMILDIEPRLLKLLHSDKCCYHVFVGKYKFRCHLAVLQAHSKYFLRKANLDKLVSHLPMEQITPVAFYTIYNWMLGIKNEKCTKKYSLCRSIVETISAATFLLVDELSEFWWSKLSAPEITENVAFALCQEAARFDIPVFLAVMLSRICKFFLTLVASREFLDLDCDVVCKLLDMDNVGVNSEIEIFMSALRWLAHSWPERQPYMVKVMHSVRFGLIPPLFLRFLQNNQQTKVLQCIYQNAEVQEMINKAFVYISTELCGFNMHHSLPDYDLPEQRMWIYDRECSYHHESNCQYFTYAEFLKYLKYLQEKGPNYWQRLPVLRDISEMSF